MCKSKNIDSLEVLKLYNTGLNSVEISQILNVSPVTIRYHYNKLGVKAQSQSQAARKYNIKEDFFSKIDSEESAYILGLLYADGCNYVSDKEVKVILELTDKLIIEKINKLLSPSKPISIKTRTRLLIGDNYYNVKPTYRIAMQSKQISNDLIKYGCSPRKSMVLKFPTFLKENLINHFIRGYFDGDGGVSKKGNSVVVSFTGTENFLNTLQAILIAEFGCNKTKIRKNSVSDIYQFSFSSKKDIKSFYKYMYFNSKTDLFILRKRNLLSILNR